MEGYGGYDEFKIPISTAVAWRAAKREGVMSKPETMLAAVLVAVGLAALLWLLVTLNGP